MLVALVATVGYWYWSGPYQEGRPDREQQRLMDNDQIMARCVREYSAISSGSSIMGMAYDPGDEEQICAEKHQLYFYQGHWRSSNP